MSHVKTSSEGVNKSVADWQELDDHRIDKAADKYLSVGRGVLITALALTIITVSALVFLCFTSHWWVATTKIMLKDALIATGAVGGGLTLTSFIVGVVFRFVFQNKKVLEKVVDSNKFIEEDTQIVNALRNFDQNDLLRVAQTNRWDELGLKGDLTLEATWQPLVLAGYITKEGAQLMAETLKNYREWWGAAKVVLDKRQYPQHLIKRRHAKLKGAAEQQQFNQCDWVAYDKAQGIIDKYQEEGTFSLCFALLNSRGYKFGDFKDCIQKNCALSRTEVTNI